MFPCSGDATARNARPEGQSRVDGHVGGHVEKGGRPYETADEDAERAPSPGQVPATPAPVYHVTAGE